MSEPDAPWQLENRQMPTPNPAPPASPAPRRRRWIIPVIILSSLAVLALLVLGFVTLVNAVAGFLSRDLDQALVDGDPASHVAVSPLDCSQPCFGPESIEATLASEAILAGLGVGDTTFPYGTYEPIRVGELYRGDAASWDAYDGSPDECFFAPTSGPYSSSLDDANADNADLVYFTGTHEDVDRLNSVDQAVRVFPDSASAQTFMADLALNAADCVVVEIGPVGERYAADIHTAPALDVPDSIAGVGWIRIGDPGPRWRAYVVDLQRGNLVIMTRLLTDGSITEEQFRSFVEDYADQIAALEPAGAATG